MAHLSHLPRAALAVVGIFLSASFLAPLPFVLISPGSGTNVLGKVITIQGSKIYPSTGKLLATTVLVTNPSAYIVGVAVLDSWLRGQSIVLPRQAIFEENLSASVIKRQASREMKISQSDAVASAFSYLGYVPTQKIISANIKLKDTGGPSAGLIFALGIIEKLTPEDLLQGRTVAGSGTINGRGEVGAIGGIAEKLIAAKGSGATIFLASTQNCDDIQHIPKGLRVYIVASLKEAVLVLRDEKNATSHCNWQ